MSYKQLTTSQIDNINSILAMQKIVKDCNRRMQEDAELNHYDPIVQMDVYEQMVDAHIEQLAETNEWSK